VLLAIALVAGLVRVAAAPDVATALGYDIEAALADPGRLLTAPRVVTPACQRTGG
jgi:hypothetical protein